MSKRFVLIPALIIIALADHSTVALAQKPQEADPGNKPRTSACPLRNPLADNLSTAVGHEAIREDTVQNPICPSPQITTVASGLFNPRGLKFGPDGHLYVTEAGTGGAHSVACVPDPPSLFDPYFSDYTGRILRIGVGSPNTIVADRLPSTLDNTNSALGVSDIAFVGRTLYALVFAGCPRFFEKVPSSVVRINPDESWEVIADLSAYFRSHPVQEPPPPAPDGDFEPDGSPYTMISLGGDLYVVEANSGQLLRVTTRGEISRVMDLSVDHPVPTAITFHDGKFYVGTFGSAGTNDAAVYEITPNGKKRTLISGLNPVLGIAFYDNKLYLLETFSGEPYSPGTGRLLRISRFGKIERTQIIACGLTFPTAMALGRDGALYISNIGYGVDPTAGLGEVVRIPIDD